MTQAEKLHGNEVWMLVQRAGEADVPDTTWAHATEVGAHDHMGELFQDLRIDIEAGRHAFYLQLVDVDDEGECWYAMEAGDTPGVEDEYASWSIERARIYQ